MADRRLQDVLFYSLESAAKAYRRFAQTRLHAAGIDITIDQWLVLKTIHESPDATLQRVGAAVFKDFASVTRIVQLLERKGLLRRTPHPCDGRRSALALTAAGESVIRTVEPIAQTNRRLALEGIGAEDLSRLRELLKRITENCDAERSTPSID
ncbi:MAG TPA: MarR family transcriptional regulator [Gemmatimonadaceae bacterium]|nr:MarR family transcriptional regulator [Gemmatimonadaceae bacterium]